MATVVLLLFILCGAKSPALADDIPLSPVRDGLHDLELKELDGGQWEVRTTGTDPYLFLKTDGRAIDLKRQPIFAFEYFSPGGIGKLLVFVGQTLDVPHLITVNDLGRSEGWAKPAIDLTATSEPPTAPVTSLRVTFGCRPGVVARLRAFRVREATEQEQSLAKTRVEHITQDRRLDKRLHDYLRESFPNQITTISINDKRITVAGRLGEHAADIQLAEVPMWEDITALENSPTLRPIPAAANGVFTMAINRRASDGRDRLLSGWALVRKVGDCFQPASALHYADDVKSRAELPKFKPRSIKGLGGCPFDSPDMQELGVASVTLNIVLSDIISTQPGPGRSDYEYAGRTWHIADGIVAGYDRHMRLAAKHGWMMSAIILIPPVGNAPSGAWSRLAAHPDADPSGAFVMPNFTTREGVEAYAAAMNFIAERYSRPDGKFGRIHFWIMHNEISSGFFWTTAGDKKLLTYLNLYQKSMRLAFLIARQYDPHAEPLISLDHCWTATPDKRCYPGRELLERLLDFSHKEGDFPWGVAYHPYAQDLTNPRTWQDHEATFTFNTPYITFKNIETLDAWMRLPRTAFHGRSRELQLTEQGLNSPDYSDKSLTEQAAGLAYAWKKIEPLATVTAFQYHLWADDRGEGGLRLGLRKFGDEPKDPFGKKPSWQLYKALGTDAWAPACEFAKPIVGVHDWNEVHHTGAIH